MGVQGSSTFESLLCREMTTAAKLPSGTTCAIATACLAERRRLESERRLSKAFTTSTVIFPNLFKSQSDAGNTDITAITANDLGKSLVAAAPAISLPGEPHEVTAKV